MPPLPIRPRRLRQSEAIRRLVREHAVVPSQLLLDALPADVDTALRLDGVGGLWLTLPASLDDALGIVEAARQVSAGHFLAADSRSVDAAPAEAALQLRAAGADLIAVNGADCAAVRDAFETEGEVNALVVACASFPLDAADETPSLPQAMGDWVRDGADFVLIEPVLPNLDRIRAASDALPVPVIGRVTPQEHASYEAAIARGWLDASKIPMEALVGGRRAGARVLVAPPAWVDAMAESEA